MFSVVYKCFFFHAAFYEDMVYNIGESDFFHLFLTASSLLEAYDRAISYFDDHCSMCDVSIISIVKVD